MTPSGKRHTMKREDLVETIIKMRINKGCSYLTIMEFIIEQGYAKSYGYELIRDAKKEINERSIINFGEDLKEEIERFEELYYQALRDGNKKEARENLKEISKLKGHYVERVDLTSGGKAINKIEIVHIKTKEDLDGNTSTENN